MDERPQPAPPPSPIGFVLGALMVELEASHPGTAKRVAGRLDDDATRAEVIRLRGPRAGSETRRALDEAVRIAEAISLLAGSLPPAPPPPKKRCWWLW